MLPQLLLVCAASALVSSAKPYAEWETSPQSGSHYTVGTWPVSRTLPVYAFVGSSPATCRASYGGRDVALKRVDASWWRPYYYAELDMVQFVGPRSVAATIACEDGNGTRSESSFTVHFELCENLTMWRTCASPVMNGCQVCEGGCTAMRDPEATECAVCGNGRVEKYEKCDDAIDPWCTNCRCSSSTHQELSNSSSRCVPNDIFAGFWVSGCADTACLKAFAQRVAGSCIASGVLSTVLCTEKHEDSSTVWVRLQWLQGYVTPYSYIGMFSRFMFLL
eukprot:m51a1_g13325 hypothetical protein (278) ;mRNA; r:369-1447